MKHANTNARAVIIEGIDGSGKDSMMHLLYNQMCRDGIAARMTSSLNRVCSKAIEHVIIRELQRPNPSAIDLKYLRGLFIANLNRTARYVESLLKSGTTVVMTRWKHSTLVYNTNTDREMYMVDYLIYNLKNPVIFYMDTPVDICVSRLAKKQAQGQTLDHFETTSQLTKAKLRYDRAIEKFNYGTVIYLDGSCPKQENFRRAYAILQEYGVVPNRTTAGSEILNRAPIGSEI